MIPPACSWQEVADYAAAQGAEPFRDLFADMGRTFFPSESEVEAGAAVDPPPDDAPRHLHLRNARPWPQRADPCRWLLPQAAPVGRLRWVLGSPQLPGGDLHRQASEDSNESAGES